MIIAYPETDRDLRNLIDQMKGMNMGQIIEMLERHDQELIDKANKSDLGPIKDEMNKLKELLDQLAKQLESL